MINQSDILYLKKQLLPTGRAFNVTEGGVFEKLLLAYADQEVEAINSTLSLLDMIIPDNDNFSEEDAAMWERVLGISTNVEDSIENRRSVIYRKMRFPGLVKGRQHKNYIEGQLRAANFPVRIYEYSDVKGLIEGTVHSEDIKHSYFTRHGALNIPEVTGIIANELREEDEVPIPITVSNLKNVFWIGGESFGEFASIDPVRIEEFRHMVLTMKPLHTVAFLRVKYENDWILATGYWNMNGHWYNSALWTS